MVPRYGWCKGKHEPNNPRPAQSGHDGYCKTCFRQLFPERFRAKQDARKQECEMCQEVKELVKGICKTCRRERKCHIDKCDWINKEVDAVRCWACTRTKIGAKNARLVMACPYHTSAEQRNSGMCSECFERQQECHHCGAMDGVSLQQLHKCSRKDCGVVLRFCSLCIGMTTAMQKLLCKSHWYED